MSGATPAGTPQFRSPTGAGQGMGQVAVQPNSGPVASPAGMMSPQVSRAVSVVAVICGMLARIFLKRDSLRAASHSLVETYG